MGLFGLTPTARMGVAVDENTARRFWGKVSRGPEGCWTWTGAINDGGYGVFFTGEADVRPAGMPRLVRAHRFAYEALFGPIPAGLDLDHLCRTRSCVRPDHLEPVTRKVNLARGVDVGVAGARAFRERTVCKNGHPFDDENSYVDARNARVCRACARQRNAKYASEVHLTRVRRSDRCKHGHMFDETNTHIQPNGERVCRACKRAATAAHRARKRAAMA